MCHKDNLLLQSLEFPELGLVGSKIILEVGWCAQGIFTVAKVAPKLAVKLFICNVFSVPFCEELIAHAWLAQGLTSASLSFSSSLIFGAQTKKSLLWFSEWFGLTPVPQYWDDILFLLGIFSRVHSVYNFP